MLFGVAISAQITLTKDSSFGNNGTATLTYPVEMEDVNFEKIFINADHSLNICLGTDGDSHTGMIAKLTSFGSLDTTYNGNGKIILNGNLHTGFEFAKQGEKMIAIYANDSNLNEPDTKIVRYQNDGSIDTAFGVNGVLAARPDLYYRQVNFQHDGFYHLWGKITGYSADGVLNSSYGSNGEQNPVINGVPQEYMELYSFFGNRGGRNFLNKYHYEIAVSKENTPHQFTSYDLSSHQFYDVAGATGGVSVYPKKFHLAPDKEIVYLFGIDPNSGNERNRVVLLDETMQPKKFWGKEFIDLGEVSAESEIRDVESFQNHYLFVGRAASKPVIIAYESNGKKSTVNGLDEFHDDSVADDYSTVLVNGNNIFVIGKRTGSREIFITKYTAKVLSTSETNPSKAYVTTPFKNELKVMSKVKTKNISVYDTSGRMIINSPKTTIATAHLPTGNYVVRVDFEDGPSQTFKSIKN